jgi:hypothetical protein
VEIHPECNGRSGDVCRMYHYMWKYVLNVRAQMEMLAVNNVGSFFTTTWRVLRLRMEETASRYEGWPRIYRISSRGQLTRSGHSVWGLSVGLTTHRKMHGVTSQNSIFFKISSDYYNEYKRLTHHVERMLLTGNITCSMFEFRDTCCVRWGPVALCAHSALV